MLDLSVLIIVLFIILFIFVVITFTHYAVHKYVNKSNICYIEDEILLINYEIIDLLICEYKTDAKTIEDETLTIDFDYINTYIDYLYKYLYQKYIEIIVK